MKTLKFSALLLSLVSLASCGGNGAKSDSDSAAPAMDATEFAATQPWESGEYNATYVEYLDSTGGRFHFDGRLLVAADPDQTVAYVYENGNRTKFTAQINLAKPFEKNDTVYTSTDAKGAPVILTVCASTDTLLFEKGTKKIKLAFDKQISSAMSAEAAREAIIAKRTK